MLVILEGVQCILFTQQHRWAITPTKRENMEGQKASCTAHAVCNIKKVSWDLLAQTAELKAKTRWKLSSIWTSYTKKTNLFF